MAGTRSRRDSSASTQASILSVLQASGGQSFDLLGVSDLDLPARQLQLVVHEPGASIDSIAAYTGSPNPPIRSANTANPPLSGTAVVTANAAPLVHHMNIQSCSTQIQPDVHHDNRPPSDTPVGHRRRRADAPLEPLANLRECATPGYQMAHSAPPE
jgi:hypothetical protein